MMDNFIIFNPVNDPVGEFRNGLHKMGITIHLDYAVQPGTAIAVGEQAVLVAENLELIAKPPVNKDYINPDECDVCHHNMRRLTVREIVGGIRVCSECGHKHIPHRDLADLLEEMYNSVNNCTNGRTR